MMHGQKNIKLRNRRLRKHLLGEIFISSSKRSDQLWSPNSALSNAYRRTFPGLRRPWLQVGHLSPFSVEVKKEELYNFISIRLHVVRRNKFIFSINNLTKNFTLLGGAGVEGVITAETFRP